MPHELKAVQVLLELFLVNIDDLSNQRTELKIDRVVYEIVQFRTHEMCQQVGLVVNLFHPFDPIF